MDDAESTYCDIVGPEFRALDRVLLHLAILHHNDACAGLSLNEIDKYARLIAKRQNDYGYFNRECEEGAVNPEAIRAVYRQIAWEMTRLISDEHPECAAILEDAYSNPGSSLRDYAGKVNEAWSKHLERRKLDKRDSLER